MPGLDRDVLTNLNPKLAIGRIKTDVQTDFVLAPHYSAVYEHAGDELWQHVGQVLGSGAYEPELPITIDVPKKSGLTRPGSILGPIDRLVYQAIVDLIATPAESQLDRGRVFSNTLLRQDPSFQMFESNHLGWTKFQQLLNRHCTDRRWPYVIKADIASFFERVYQHNIINLLHSAGCPPKAVHFLERVLSAWMEKDSHGILQGMFPSDFLGNFSLCGLDADLGDRGVPFIRYVDDIYLFYPSLDEARRGLVELCRTLRNDGLHLNESKSGILNSHSLLREETELDRKFKSARAEIEESMGGTEVYGFLTFWKSEEEEATEEDIESEAVELLYGEVASASAAQAEKIERFCLPILSATGSEIAIERCLGGIGDRPHLVQLYSAYLARFVSSKTEIVRGLESLVRKGDLIYDWQLMWPIAALIPAGSVSNQTVTSAFRTLRDSSRSVAVRALCALLIGRHGSAGQRHNLRGHYSSESSPYVRSGILFATRYFPSQERNTCLGAWKGHSTTNTLIAHAVRALA